MINEKMFIFSHDVKYNDIVQMKVYIDNLEHKLDRFIKANKDVNKENLLDKKDKLNKVLTIKFQIGDTSQYILSKRDEMIIDYYNKKYEELMFEGLIRLYKQASLNENKPINYEVFTRSDFVKNFDDYIQFL